MPKYFYHEAGAGMLNTYAAVLQAAFRTVSWALLLPASMRESRCILTIYDAGLFAGVYPGLPSHTFSLPPDTVQASANIAWPFSANDIGSSFSTARTLFSANQIT